ncbi:MAG: membrane protein insertion efficiency factor YidD [Jatrophihabitans sp.]
MTTAAGVGRQRGGLIAHVFVTVISFYRVAVSPLRPAACRYTPSCSGYALEAIQIHGAARGSWLALRRLLRCHPFHAGGHDPVPSRVGASADESAEHKVEPSFVRPPRTVA